MSKTDTSSFTENWKLDTETTTFIVLDLETTWLDTNTETIMEIAAIRFTIERAGDRSYRATNVEERSMLINPEREVTEEISMITHITGDMLIGKPTWEEVRERVYEFLKWSVIVGHNVLFDVAMLKSHGINLEDAVILDTFELSELFSSDSESLNLWFLGSKYWFKTDKWEHRALWDTEICLSLFLYYLGELEKAPTKVKSILSLISKREQKKNIGYLMEFLSLTDIPEYGLDEQKYRTTSVMPEKKRKTWNEDILTPRVVSLSGRKEEEMNLLKELIKDQKHIHLLTSGSKVSTHMEDILTTAWFRCTEWIPKKKLCSLRYIEECILWNVPLERKLSILLGRVLIWLEQTEYGRIDEMKMYWREYEYVENFQMDESEMNNFSMLQEEKEEKAQIVIYTTYDYIKTPHNEPDCLIIKDVGFFDDGVRKAKSFTLDITALKELIKIEVKDSAIAEKILSALSHIEHIYTSIPERPTWNSEFPPGGFGETYFFDQKKLWKEGGVWLLLATRLLRWYSEHLTPPDGWWVQSRKNWKEISSCIEFLIEYHTHTSSCTSIVLDIGREWTVIRYIPHSLIHTITEITTLWAKEDVLLYGHGISGKKVASFLEKECGLFVQTSTPEKREKWEIQISESLRWKDLRWSVILTTSMRHIRDIGKECERMWVKTLMQGISGGKSKMLSLFEKNIEDTVLIWLIDSWRDEYQLWWLARWCIVAKLPFDPPSDPYFLARTVWMSNNFAHYSEPMVIIRINTLVWRIRSAGYDGEIYTLDERLSTSAWWMWVWKELL